MQLNATKVGILFAMVTGGTHLLWSILVAAGWAQSFINFVFWAHFIKPIHVVVRFEIARAVALLVLSASIGFLFGLAAGLVWNVLHRAPRSSEHAAHRRSRSVRQ
jgi:hypothetical protein